MGGSRGWGKGRGEKRALEEKEEEEEAVISLVLSTFSPLLSTRDLPSVSQADGLAQRLSPRRPRLPSSPLLLEDEDAREKKSWNLSLCDLEGLHFECQLNKE